VATLEATSRSDTSMLSIKDLCFAFNGTKPIFQNLHMEVQAGEFVSVIGASGCGKSTLFQLITGLLEPNQGVIHMNHNSSTKRLGNVGYMPQKDLLLPWRTVLENVLLPLEVKKEQFSERFAEVHEWLSRFGLEGYENAYPHELSGGMKQRVAFLRTLMTGRNLLLLDEPFGALDSMTKRTMHSWLLGLWNDLQKTVLFITHDLEEAILLSDRIYLMNQDDQPIKEIKVNLPRPRTSTVIYEADFIGMRKELERLIYDKG
jgi:putative hydroxymethylpyrimidine transport system ATP-binding protein